MPERAKTLLYLLGLMILILILVLALAACGGGSIEASTAATATGPSAGGQVTSPSATPISTAAHPASSPAASPTTAGQSTTPEMAAGLTPSYTPTPPPVAASTPAGLGQVVLSDSWFISPSIGWLAGHGCVQVKPGTSSGQPPVMQCTGVIYHTVDGGKHWLTLVTGKLIPCKIEFTSDKTGWLIGIKNGDCFGQKLGTGVIQQTSDGGVSWTTRYLTSRPGILPVDLSFTSNDQGWVTLSDCPREENPCSWQVVSTTDAGRSWNTATVPITAHEMSLAHPDANDGWVIADGDNRVNIADSHDGDRTWQLRLIPAQLGGWRATIFFLNAQQGWFLTGGEPGAGQEYKELYGTTDGGKTWSMVAGPSIKPLAPGPLGSSGYVDPIVFTSPEHGWAFLPRLGVLQTTDGGKRWEAGSPFNDGAGSEEGLYFNGQEFGWSTFEGFVMLTSNGGTSWHGVPMPAGVSRSYGSPSG